MNAQTQPHIGKIIQAKLKEQRRSVTWLANQIPCTRDNIYKIFSKQWISTDMLMQISLLMDCNFFIFLSNYYQDSKQDETLSTSANITEL